MASNRQRSVQQEKLTSDPEAAAETLCVVCFKPIVYFAIGECDHLCCYECSTRIRVLCRQNDCPICRRDLSKVIFCKVLMPYQQLETKNRSGLYDKKYRICFTEVEVQQAFFDLLDNKCPRCDEKNFPKFELLREHVRKKHEMFYCDICTEHLKVFSSERRCYNRQELALHRRKGDPDKVGHRGHPLCEYCDTRFLDKDELFRHLRKDHFFCHYCDADGRNYFYGDYTSLREHFRSDHFLCEEGDCEQEQFTSVFRSEIDLRAHRATAHGKTMNRQTNKQTRTLELEFSYAPRHAMAPGSSGAGPGGGAVGGVSNNGGPSGRSRGGGNGSGRGGRGDGRDVMNHETQREFEMLVESTQQQQTVQQHPKRVIDATSEQDFPSLGGTAPNPVFRPNNVSIRQRVYGAAGLARTKENFPALGSEGGESTGPTSLNEGFSSKITASSLLKPSQPSSSAGRAAAVVAGGTSMMIHVSNRPPNSGTPSVVGKRNQADFPALPGSSKGLSGASVGRKGTDMFADMPDDRGGGSGMVNLNAMSAKHRAMADDYVSVSSVVSKVNTIEVKDTKKSSSSTQMVIPSVNSTKAFPTLGEASVPTAAKPASWVSGATKASTNASAASGNSTLSSKKKPAPAPNLKDDGGFVNLNVLTGKKSGEKSSKSKDAHAKADARNNNATESMSKSNSAVLKDRSKEQQKPTPKVNGSNGAPTASNNNPASTNNSTTLNAKRDRLNNRGDPGEAYPSIGSDSIRLALGGNNADLALAAAPKRTPPGFENVNVKRVPAPPPGFGHAVTLNSVARNTNHMTFINSNGESYNILPSHSYVAPSNATKRNHSLVTQFQRTLKSPEALAEFRTISQMFRDGQYNAPAYYEHCKAALGDRFTDTFPELIALLPNIAKQQELYLVYCQDEKSRARPAAKGKATSAVSKLEVCQVCKQVLLSDELTEHKQTHYLENNFPKLATNATNDEGKVGSSAWKK
ncbi:E3 ubiquitin-protein ligase ZNF598 [Anopheles bellator]|uniref:E3 ubiquitin-protein ligase ZNF598 n=1 Tax=Anopheles bellator TaxID=139047 RepID=UPI002647B51F|nr:E3 ubiquitin-protein ligase ZNF598 [Anopheles bellator]